MKLIRLVSIAAFAIAAAFAQTAFPPSGGVSGGGGSVFTGSTGATNPCGATPTISLADVSGTKSTTVVTCTLSVNITGISFTNIPAGGGARFSLSFIQPVSGGPYTVSYGGSAIDTCEDSITLKAGITTTQQLEVQPDGVTIAGKGCSNNQDGVSVTGKAMAAITTTAAGQVTCTFDNTAYTDVCYGNNDGVRKAVPRVASGNQIASTDMSDAAILQTKALSQSGATLSVTETSASATVYTATMSPTLLAYTTNQRLNWKVGTSCTGGTATTMNVDGLGAKALKESDGTTDPVAADCATGKLLTIGYDGTVFRIGGTPAGGGSGGGFYQAKKGVVGSVTLGGSDSAIYTQSSVPALAAGSCYAVNVVVNDTAAGSMTISLYKDATKVATLGNISGSGYLLRRGFTYCNNTGVQNAQTVTIQDGWYILNNGTGTLWTEDMTASSGGLPTTTSVDLSTSFTLSIQGTGSGAANGHSLEIR